MEVTSQVLLVMLPPRLLCMCERCYIRYMQHCERVNEEEHIGTITLGTGLPLRRQSGTRRWSSPTAGCASRTAACWTEPSGRSRRQPRTRLARVQWRAGTRLWGRGWKKPSELPGWGLRRRSLDLWLVGWSAVLVCFVGAVGEQSLAEASQR